MDLTRRNTLLDTSSFARWTNDIFLKSMDKYAYARGVLGFTIMSFYLGYSLRVYLNIYILITLYLIVYRIPRFWVKRMLLFFFEFCYWGNLLVLFFIYFCPGSKVIFKMAYVCGTGVITLAALILNNQAQFNNTDHLTSSYIHTSPLITMWAIRWRKSIYWQPILDTLGYEFYEVGADIKFGFDSEFYQLIILPLCFWTIWAILYYVLFLRLCSGLIDNPKYPNGVSDFKKMAKKMKIFGDPEKNTNLKYMVQHLSGFVIAMPLAWVSYYNFFFNTLYVLGVVAFICFNASIKSWNHMNKQIKKFEKEIAPDNNGELKKE